MLSDDSESDGIQTGDETAMRFSRQEELVWVLLNHHHFLQVP
jgi:hypothetical protein